MTESSRPQQQPTRTRPDDLRPFQEAFARAFAAAASALLRTEVCVRPAGLGRGDARAGEHRTVCRLPMATAAAGGAGEGGGGQLWLGLSAGAAYAAVDRLLGGGGEGGHIPERPLTAVERGLMRPLAEAARGSVLEAWPAEGAALAPLRGEARAPGGDEGEVIAAFTLEMDGRGGAAWLTLPSGALRPPAADARKPRQSVELSASLPQTPLPVEELTRLAPGDLLATGAEADAEVTVRVAGIPKYVARLGRHGGRRAVTITRRFGEKEKHGE
jgi:flagellar motor switch protein FliM